MATQATFHEIDDESTITSDHDRLKRSKFDQAHIMIANSPKKESEENKLVLECESAFEDEDVLMNIKIPDDKFKHFQRNSNKQCTFRNYGNRTFLDKMENTYIEGIIGTSL